MERVDCCLKPQIQELELELEFWADNTKRYAASVLSEKIYKSFSGDNTKIIEHAREILTYVFFLFKYLYLLVFTSVGNDCCRDSLEYLLMGYSRTPNSAHASK